MEGLSLKEIIQLIGNGGATIIIFVIYFLSNRQNERQQKLQNDTSEAAFKKHTELNSELIQLLKDDQDYKLQLAGLLDRISIRLETPAQCPILMTGKKFKLEVTE